jgi:three-Cys-motif partner protein
VPVRPTDDATVHFSDPKREWAGIKHRLLENYLVPYCAKLSSLSNRVMIVDGFAGAGRYADGTDGSPVIAAKLNENPALTGRVTVCVLAVEADSSNAARLRVALSPWLSAKAPVVKVLEGPFHQHIVKIAKWAAPVPTFVFLDPYGMKDLTIEALDPLIRSPQSMKLELLVRVDVGTVSRMLGKAIADRREGRSSGETLIRRLEGLGVSPETMGDVLNDELDADEKRSALLYDYQQLVATHFPYVQAVPVSPRHGQAPKYFLLHATRHPMGYTLMNDVAASLLHEQKERHYREQNAEQPMFEGLDEATRAPETDPEMLENSMLAIIREAGPTGIDGLRVRAYVVDEFATQFWAPHHRAAMKALEQRGQIRIDRGKGSARSRIERWHLTAV